MLKKPKKKINIALTQEAGEEEEEEEEEEEAPVRRWENKYPKKVKITADRAY